MTLIELLNVHFVCLFISIHDFIIFVCTLNGWAVTLYECWLLNRPYLFQSALITVSKLIQTKWMPWYLAGQG